MHAVRFLFLFAVLDTPTLEVPMRNRNSKNRTNTLLWVSLYGFGCMSTGTVLLLVIAYPNYGWHSFLGLPALSVALVTFVAWLALGAIAFIISQLTQEKLFWLIGGVLGAALVGAAIGL